MPTQDNIDQAARPPARPEPGSYSLGGTRLEARRAPQTPAVLSRWLLLTVPVGLLAALVPLNTVDGHHIPSLVRDFAGLAIACIGSPRARLAAIFCLAFLVAAAAWVS
jgi:hypothetical protein